MNDFFCYHELEDCSQKLERERVKPSTEILFMANNQAVSRSIYRLKLFLKTKQMLKQVQHKRRSSDN